MTRRNDDRQPDVLRPFQIDCDVPGAASGKVIVRAGRTTVLCTASIDNQLPPWLAGQGKGWVTAEYNMLPGSTRPRKQRDRAGKLDGRTSEIQRLIGRSLRAVVNLTSLGERLITVDCDVLEADGGTRTASITGGYLALIRALSSLEEFSGGNPLPLTGSVAAVSVGIVDGVPLLDLDYEEDVRATADMNVVMTGQGQFVEVQGSGEEATFSSDELQAMITLAQRGIADLTKIQHAVLSTDS